MMSFYKKIVCSIAVLASYVSSAYASINDGADNDTEPMSSGMLGFLALLVIAFGALFMLMGHGDNSKQGNEDSRNGCLFIAFGIIGFIVCDKSCS